MISLPDERAVAKHEVGRRAVYGALAANVIRPIDEIADVHTIDVRSRIREDMRTFLALHIMLVGSLQGVTRTAMSKATGLGGISFGEREGGWTWKCICTQSVPRPAPLTGVIQVREEFFPV